MPTFRCRYLAEQELRELLETGFKTGVPSHTPTERVVKLTAEAAACVTGVARQDGLTLNELALSATSRSLESRCGDVMDEWHLINDICFVKYTFCSFQHVLVSA